MAILVLAVAATACGELPLVRTASAPPTPSPGIGETPASTPESPRPMPGRDAARDLVIVDSGYTWTAPYVTWAVILENPNPNWFADDVAFYVTFPDAAGTDVTASFAAVRLAPGQRTAVGGTEEAPTAPASIVVEVDVGDWYAADAPNGEFTFDQVTTVEHEGGISTTGIVRSSFAEEVAVSVVVAVHRNAAGDIIGGGMYPPGLGFEDCCLVPVIAPGRQLHFEIRSLAPLPLSSIAATTMYLLETIPMEAH